MNFELILHFWFFSLFKSFDFVWFFNIKIFKKILILWKICLKNSLKTILFQNQFQNLFKTLFKTSFNKSFYQVPFLRRLVIVKRSFTCYSVVWVYGDCSASSVKVKSTPLSMKDTHSDIYHPVRPFFKWWDKTLYTHYF